MKISRLFLIMLALVLSLLFGCDGEGDGQIETTGEEASAAMADIIKGGATEYILVRSDDSEGNETKAALNLRRAVNAVGDFEMKITTDYDEATPLEILVGNTNRPETAEVIGRLGGDDYRIEILNGKLVIVAVDEMSLITAVRNFSRDVLGYNSASDFEVKGSLSLAPDYIFSGTRAADMIVPDPRNEGDFLVASANVFDFGATGDGTTDDTKAFQEAIDYVYGIGGGTVYAPAGSYLIMGDLEIKRSVYLAGAWYNPELYPDKIKAGTILLAMGDKGDEEGTPLLTVGASAGLLGLTVYYPEQDIASPEKYPASVLILDSLAGDGTQHAASVSNVTIANGWRAIAADRGNQLARIDNVYASVLDYGFKIDGCYDCTRITTMHIAPDYWAAFTGEPVEAIAAEMKKNAVGFILMYTDGQMMYDTYVKSCKTALHLGGGYTNMLDFAAEDCTVAIDHEIGSVNVTSGSFLCTGEGAVGINVRENASGTIRFYDCDINAPTGEALVIGEGSSATVSIQDSRLVSADDKYAVTTKGSVIMLSGNDFGPSSRAFNIAEGTLSAVVSNNKFTGTTEVTADPEVCIVTTESSATLPTPIDTSLELPAAPPVVAKSSSVFDIKKYGAVGDGKTDDTNAIKSALEAANASGGGVVYVPAGYYLTSSSITIPSGVELRGIHESLHVTTGEGSVIYVTANKGNEDAEAFITMEAGSALRGLTFWYPEQAWNKIVEYPWTISVGGKGCVLRNICIGNGYKGIDMTSADCGGHYVDNITGCLLKNGISLDGSSSGGVIMNTHFNSTFYYAVWGTKLSDASGAFGSGDMAVALFNQANRALTGFSFGKTTDEQLLFIFNYRARYGIEFTGSFDGKVLGCGVDGSLCGMKATGDYKNELVISNLMNDLVPGETPEGNVGIYIDVTDTSTVRLIASGVSSYNYVPTHLLRLVGGNLTIDNFTANYTPANGSSILVEGGHAELSGLEFGHVGPLDGNGGFVEQRQNRRMFDIYVKEGATANVYSAVGRRFFAEKVEGEVGVLEFTIAD